MFAYKDKYSILRIFKDILHFVIQPNVTSKSRKHRWFTQFV